MKKFLLSLLLVLPLCSFAQKGMQGAGLSFGAGLDFSYGELVYSYRAIYQNFITDRFRISASLYLHNQYLALNDYGYYESGDPFDGLRGNTYLAGFEGHYFFNEVRRLRPYVMGGVLIGASRSKRINYYENRRDYYNHENLQNRVQQFAGGVKLGVGLNYRISYNLMAQFEVPFYYLIEDYFPMIPCLNFVYTF